MQKYNPDPATKKVKYIASIVYLLILSFVVIGSYIHQQKPSLEKTIKEDIIWIKKEP